jgi:UDP-glucose 4-epimerase
MFMIFLKEDFLLVRVLITGGAGYIGSHTLKALGETRLHDFSI